jgi:biofilm PGA synthesis N-glycosyltransferase PgaC
MLDDPQLGGFVRRDHPGTGMRPTVRFVLALLVTVAWVGFAVWASGPWRHDLEQAIGPIAAWVIPLLLAYVPGLVIGFMAATLVVSPYHEPALEPPSGTWPAGEWPSITVLIAARNEEASIEKTLERVAASRYGGEIAVLLADNGSTDRTAASAATAAARLGLPYRRVAEPEPGKFHALNRALGEVDTPIVVTLDADTYLHEQALSYLVAHVGSRPQGQHVAACAGALIVENPTQTFMTRMQQWDYRLGINGVKRMQGAYNSALVAQGAFSAYWTEDLRAVGGWPDAIGEDIVLTWTMLDSRGIVQYEPLALASTSVPAQVGVFMRQRSRWARGMFEGIGAVPPWRQPRVLAKVVAGIDYLVPLLDVGYVFFWIPGVILALFGYPLIFSWWSMLLLPLTVLIYGLLRRWQEQHVLEPFHVGLPADRRGFFGYLLGYQALASSASLRGYWQFVAGSRRSWK